MAGADILGVGMMTAVGVGAAETAASVHAGIARLTESSVHNRRFNPIVMSAVPEAELPPLEKSLDQIPGLTSRQTRMLRLAGPALREAVADVGGVADVPLLLAVPEALPDRADPAGPKFLEHLAKQSGVAFEIAASRAFANGRAGGFLALKEALALLAGGTVSRVLVGGVDTYLDLHLLGTLDAEDRALADGVMDGFPPGEGAAFLLLGPRAPGAFARVVAAATGAESGHRYSEEPYRGDGLAATFQSVFAAKGAADEPVTTVLAGLNGESFGAKEWGVAYVRSREHFVDDFALTHPVDCFGDAGAALGPLLMGLAAIGIRKGYLREPCLAWCSSDREERGAALLRGASS